MGGNRVRSNVIETVQAIFQAVTHLLSTMEGLPATSRELCRARISVLDGTKDSEMGGHLNNISLSIQQRLKECYYEYLTKGER